MESNQSILGEELSISPSINSHLSEASRWCRFMSIVSIVFLVILLLGAIAGGSAVSGILVDRFPKIGGSLISGLFIVIAIVICAIGGVLVYFLFRFSVNTKKGLQLNNQELFNSGLAALKNYFIVYGVIAIISLLFSLISLVAIF